MTGGVKAALDGAVEQLPEAEGFVQAALFDDLDATETGALDAASPLAGAITPAKRSRGRPLGSRNRRTDAVAQWLLSFNRHPVQVMMEAYAMPPAELAARIGLRRSVHTITETTTAPDGKVTVVKREVEGEGYDNEVLLDLLKLQLRMAEAAAPYVAQKLPQAVQLDARAGLTLQFGGVSFPARGEVSGNSDAIDGEVMKVSLPFKSDGQSRTDSQDPENIED